MRITSKIQKRIGALVTISVLLLFSALIRVGMHTGQAFAKESSEKTAMAEGVASPKLVDQDAVALILEQLKIKEESLVMREREIQLRQTALKEAEYEIESKIEQLKNAERQLRDTMALADGAAESDLAKLTTVYEAMKPKDAAELFETMDPQFAAGFLGRMKPSAAAGIMAGLTPEVAYSFSALLASRNSSVPTE